MASTVFTLNAEHVTLGQLLKLTGVIGSGGEAKLFLSESPPMVNGEIEGRRGRKLRDGDIVVVPGVLTISIVDEAKTLGVPKSDGIR